ncbi:MAG: FAD-binding oxidoreductase [Frondihabitans sp.]|nr:FAD-binding oxidoreductase [Frondihabitans sp.]
MTRIRHATAPDGTSPALAELVERLGEAVLTSAEDMGQFRGDASRAEIAALPLAVVAARTTADISTALAWANRHGIRVSVRGSGTGLAGGAVAYPQGLVISLSRMSRILSIDPASRLARVEAGVITADIDDAAAEFGLMYAPDPASYRQSTIGGNIATNAGGLRCVKYGVTADSIAGLEVVLANGDVISTGSDTRKNVVGYDLTHLFVGSEGTLGVVTAATVRLRPRPVGATVTFRALFPTTAAAGKAVDSIMAGSVVPEMLELMDRLSVEIVEKHYPTGVDTGSAAAVLVGQFIGATAADDASAALEQCRRAGSVSVESGEGDILLEARRVASRALSAEGLRVSSDVAVPISRLAEMFAAIDRISSEEGVPIPTFAHAGDGNLHPSVIVTSDDQETLDRAERILERISTEALRLGGTLSGEHGVGSLKYASLGRQLDPATLATHRAIRLALDPNQILSPGRGV